MSARKKLTAKAVNIEEQKVTINFEASFSAWKNHAFESFKKEVVRTPATITYDNVSEQETKDYGTAVTIEALFYRHEDVTDKAKQGLLQNADAIIQTLPTQTITKGDKIAYGGENYEIIKQPTMRRLNGVSFYYLGLCVKI